MTSLATTITVIDACGRAGVPVLLMSDPGMGKSSLVRSIAAAEDVPCETVIGSIREPADIAGLPIVTDDGVVLSPPAWAQRLALAGAGYAFLDEITTAPPSVQAALLTVALDRVVGDLTLPKDVRVIAGANPADRAADGYDLAPPLANRFCHIDYSPSLDEFLTGSTVGWAAPPPSRAVAADDASAHTVRSSVLGFLRTRPDLLHAFPETSDATGGAWPSRRTWTMLMDTLAHVRSDDADARRAVTFGLIGEGAGIAFLTWVATMDLPAPGDVVADPSIVDWADRPDRVWAILAGVVAWATEAGTQVAWKDAWGPLLAAAEAGTVDVAASAARALNRSRPANAKPPAKVRDLFAPVLREAGLSVAGDAA